MSKNDEIKTDLKRCKKPPFFPLVAIRREQWTLRNVFPVLSHMWAVWKPMVIKGNHHRRKMAGNSAMMCLKWGQKWSGSCSGSEMQRENLLVINLWKICPKTTGGEGSNHLPDQSSRLRYLQPRLENTDYPHVRWGVGNSEWSCLETGTGNTLPQGTQ